MFREIAAFLLLAATVTGQARQGGARPGPANVPNADGVIESFDFSRVDDLLQLEKIPVRMITFKQAGNEEVSSVHLEKFKAWVSGGGLAYFTADSLNGALYKKLQFPILTEHRIFKKESGSYVDSNTGELFVKGALPNIVIHDHAITRNVGSLYVTTGAKIGWYYFTLSGRAVQKSLFTLFVLNEKDSYELETPTAPQNSVWGDLRFKPILQVANSNYQIGGNRPGRYVIFAVIERDKGLFVLDGTGLGLGTGAFQRNSYDWPTMYKNVLNYRADSGADQPQRAEPPRRPLREVPTQFSFSAIGKLRDKKGRLKGRATAGTLVISRSQLNWTPETGSGLTLPFNVIENVENSRGVAINSRGVAIFPTSVAAKRMKLQPSYVFDLQRGQATDNEGLALGLRHLCKMR
jgi:hypothetical protein